MNTPYCEYEVRVVARPTVIAQRRREKRRKEALGPLWMFLGCGLMLLLGLALQFEIVKRGPAPIPPEQAPLIFSSRWDRLPSAPADLPPPTLAPSPRPILADDERIVGAESPSPVRREAAPTPVVEPAPQPAPPDASTRAELEALRLRLALMLFEAAQRQAGVTPSAPAAPQARLVAVESAPAVEGAAPWQAPLRPLTTPSEPERASSAPSAKKTASEPRIPGL